MKKEVFILATGSSLLNLTPEEKEHINSSESIAVNRFLMHHTIVGIIPKNWIFWDADNARDRICENTYLAADKLGVNWYIRAPHMEYLKSLNYNPISNIYYIPFKTTNRGWANNLSEPLFWCSITGMAVNLATILYPDYNIKIVGMDGGENLHFFLPSKKLNNKSNIKHNSANWFPWGIPVMKKETAIRGVNIYTTNKTSDYTFTEGADRNRTLEYKSILEV